jgi:hypothetical protein
MTLTGLITILFVYCALLTGLPLLISKWTERGKRKPKPTIHLVFTEECFVRLRTGGPETFETPDVILRLTYREKVNPANVQTGDGPYLADLCDDDPFSWKNVTGSSGW